MRMTLSSDSTALPLYEELQAKLHDEGLEEWIKRVRVSIIEETEQRLSEYKYGARMGFTPSQRWRSTASDPFPYCKLQRAETDMIRSEWMNMGNSQGIMDKFMNLHCLETNVMEGTLQFNESVFAKLVQVGFSNQVGEPIDEQGLTGGAVRSCADALSILQDTHQALGEIFKPLTSTDSPILTVEKICRLHKMLMSTCRVLIINTPYGPRFSYTNIGVTRQTSRVNVIISTGQDLKIQFCPYDQVDAELTIFCDRFNQLLQQDDMDPFAAAAWINHVFVTIHPFEDGNGRLSRILASIPLLKRRLPPLCIPSSFKKPYNHFLNFVRANRDGDYSGLMKNLYLGTTASLILLSSLIRAEGISDAVINM